MNHFLSSNILGIIFAKYELGWPLSGFAEGSIFGELMCKGAICPPSGQVGKGRKKRFRLSVELPLKKSACDEDKEGVVRTDHTFSFWGIKFLHLHYKVVQA